MPKVSTAARDATRKHQAAAAAKAAKTGRGHKAGVLDPRTPAKKRAILKSLAAGASVTTACGLANCDRSMYYAWLKVDKVFAAAADAAQAKAIKSVEDAMFRRARSMTYQGGVTAGIFILKNRRPEDYQDVHQLHLGGAVGVDRLGVLKALADSGEAADGGTGGEGAGDAAAPDA